MNFAVRKLLFSPTTLSRLNRRERLCALCLHNWTNHLPGGHPPHYPGCFQAQWLEWFLPEPGICPRLQPAFYKTISPTFENIWHKSVLGKTVHHSVLHPISSCGAGNITKGLLCTRQALYHWAVSPALGCTPFIELPICFHSQPNSSFLSSPASLEDIPTTLSNNSLFSWGRCTQTDDPKLRPPLCQASRSVRGQVPHPTHPPQALLTAQCSFSTAEYIPEERHQGQAVPFVMLRACQLTNQKKIYYSLQWMCALQCPPHHSHSLKKDFLIISFEVGIAHCMPR